MGRDEALLRMATGDSRPILRTYAWCEPTISLGYFQNVNEIEPLRKQLREMPLVRRSTGGGAILHDFELTYSLVLPINHPLIVGRPNQLYALVHQAVMQAVGDTLPGSAAVGLHKDHDLVARAGLDQAYRAQHGPFFCFARRSGFDVVVNRAGGTIDKLAGSAQRRTMSSVLQHGSIILASRFDEQPCATWSGCALRSMNMDEAARRFVEALAATLEASITHRRWTDEEQSMAAHYREMHASFAWLHNRVREAELPK